MTSTAEILKAARKLIEKPENWTQGAYARDESGKGVGVYSRRAKCFCSVGALMHASDGNASAQIRARKALTKFAPFGIADFNDDADHSEVLDLFSKAIAAAEASS